MTAPNISESPLTIPSGDGQMSARLYAPEHPKAIAVVNGATGVPQRTYRSFARWLAAERGVACLTYDYRDFASSLTRPITESRITMADWSLHDATAARQEAERRFPGLPLWVIGQSLGALLIAFQPGAERIDRVIAVSSGPVHHSDHPVWFRPLVMLNWWGVGPVATRILGYFPGSWLGLGEDIPSTVFWQWRRWCTTRGFFDAEIGSTLPALPRRIRTRARFVSASDDIMVPTSAAWRLIPYYEGCEIEKKVLHPTDYGLKRIGHIGPLRSAAKAVWPAIVD